MNYIHFPVQKQLFVIAVSFALGLMVYLTIATMRSNYGESPFTEVAEWITANAYYSMLYKMRVATLGEKSQTASALTPSTQPTTSAATDNAVAVPALIYHSIAHENEEQNFTRASFENQMFALKTAGWQTVSLADFQAFMRGEKSLPERSFLLTFDDGAKNSYHPVDTLLRALDYNAVSFILPKYSLDAGSHYYLSDNEIEQMLASGNWEIESHGQDSHEFLPIDGNGATGAALANRLWLAEQNRLETTTEFMNRISTDLETAKHEIEEHFGITVTSFAFPFGEFGHLSQNFSEASDIITTVARNVYDMSFYQWWPGEGFTSNYPRIQREELYKRIEPRTDWSGSRLLALLEQGLPKRLPYAATLNAAEGWMPDWGVIEYADTSMRLKPDPNGTGATAVLDGTGAWRDYTVEADVRSPAKTGFALFVRYRNAENNAYCNFGTAFVHIEQVVEGERRVIMGVRKENMLPTGTIHAEVRVEGRKISCLLNDESIVSTEFLAEELDSGGIAIKTWSPVPNLSTLYVDDIRVTTPPSVRAPK